MTFGYESNIVRSSYITTYSMNLMVYKCEDPTRNITIYRANCVHDNEQQFFGALQFILSAAPTAIARMIIDEYS